MFTCVLVQLSHSDHTPYEPHLQFSGCSDLQKTHKTVRQDERLVIINLNNCKTPYQPYKYCWQMIQRTYLTCEVRTSSMKDWARVCRMIWKYKYCGRIYSNSVYMQMCGLCMVGIHWKTTASYHLIVKSFIRQNSTNTNSGVLVSNAYMFQNIWDKPNQHQLLI